MFDIRVVDLTTHPDTSNLYCGKVGADGTETLTFAPADRVTHVLEADENTHQFNNNGQHPTHGLLYVEQRCPGGAHMGIDGYGLPCSCGSGGACTICRDAPSGLAYSPSTYWLRTEAGHQHDPVVESHAALTMTFDVVNGGYQYSPDLHLLKANTIHGGCQVFQRGDSGTLLNSIAQSTKSMPVLLPDGSWRTVRCAAYPPPGEPPSPPSPLPLQPPPSSPPVPGFPSDLGFCWNGNWPLFNTRVEAAEHSPGCADYLCTERCANQFYNCDDHCGPLADAPLLQPDSSYNTLPKCFTYMEYFDPTATPNIYSGQTESSASGAWVNKFIPVITDGSLQITRCSQDCYAPDGVTFNGEWWAATCHGSNNCCLRQGGTTDRNDPLIPCPGCLEGSQRSPITPPPSPPPVTPPPPSPPPVPPPSPPAGTVSKSNVLADGGFVSCAHNEVLTMADRNNVAVYGMLYAYYPSGNSGACKNGGEIASAAGSVPSGWALATLNSAGNPAQGTGVTANLEFVSHGGVHYVTVQKSTNDGPKCLAYYATTDADAVSAYNEISEYWPAFLPDGTREAAVNCVAQAPSTPPPPAVPSPPFSPPLRCGPMGSRYPGWRPDDNGGVVYTRSSVWQSGVHPYTGLPLKDVGTTGLKLFDHHPDHPNQHPHAHTIGSMGRYGGGTGAQVTEGSEGEWQSILNNAWMQNEFPGGITPSGNNADGVPYDFDCAKECTMHYETFGTLDDTTMSGWEHRLKSYKDRPNPRFNDNIPFFSVRAPGGGLIEQKRLKYDNIDMCRACRQKCCQRACCDGDDDDSWTWGCDVFPPEDQPGRAHPDGRQQQRR